jgi:putative colanic acid biosynthesis acetyltransferase WcaF
VDRAAAGNFEQDPASSVPVIPLRQAPGERTAWDRGIGVVLAWSVVELVLVTNPWQISSRIRVQALRAFGAEIGRGVVFRPRTRVRFPWKLRVGDGSWIGEGVWIHNQDGVRIGNDVVISQETFLTTGSHAHRKDMALITRPISIDDGAWITSRCMVLGGATIGRSALIRPMSVVSGDVPANTVVSGNPAVPIGQRFPAESDER